MVVIGPPRAWAAENLPEWDGGQTYLLEQMYHELADLCGFQATILTQSYLQSMLKTQQNASWVWFIQCFKWVIPYKSHKLIN